MELEKGTILKTVKFGEVYYGRITRVNEKTYTIDYYNLARKETLKDQHQFVWAVVSQEEIEGLSLLESKTEQINTLLIEARKTFVNFDKARKEFEKQIGIIRHELDKLDKLDF